jgi:DNA replication protein DnaC
VSDLQHQRLAELSRELRLSAVPDLYSAIAQSAAAKAASFADFLEEILRAERDARRARAREMFARVAGFPTVKTLDGFDFGFATGVPRRQIHELAGLAFIERAENIVFLGPTAGPLERGDAPRDQCLQAVDHRRDRLPAAGTRTGQSVLPGGRQAL